MKRERVFVEVNKGLRDSVTLPILSYETETWILAVAQQAKIRALEVC